MPKKTVCFIHNHKVAGTAIRLAVRENMPGKFYWNGMPKMPCEWGELDSDRLSEVDLVAGHLPRSLFDEKVGGEKVYLYLARNPVRRAVSLFEYITNGWAKRHPWREDLKSNGLMWAIENHDGFRWQAMNDQCRMLSGQPTFDAALASLEDGEWIVDLSHNVQRAWDEACGVMNWPRMTLSRAIEGRSGYFEDLTTPAIIEALSHLNQEDAKLVNYIQGMVQDPAEAVAT